jgi:hypothetical protein
MEKTMVRTVADGSGYHSSRPTVPAGKQPHIENRITDPSSCFPKGEHYPIPAFFEYRCKWKESQSK